MKPEYTASEVARHVGARLEGDPERTLRGIAALGEACESDLAFLERPALAPRIADAPPGALLLREGVEVEAPRTTLLRVDEPQVAFARAIPLFRPPTERRHGIHPTASIGHGAHLGDDVWIGPHVVIGAGAVLGDRCEIAAAALIDDGVRLGRDCRVGHGASVLRGSRLGDRVVLHEGVRVGSEGFGFVPGPEGLVKVPQVGACRIGDDVEIGANSTVDRGALGDTVIGARTKIDNLVQIGHNVRVGEDCVIVAQVGLAGSVEVGRGARLGGQVGVSGHCTIGPGASVAAQSGVIGDVPAGATYGGYPARPHREWLRATAAARAFAAARARLTALERRLEGRAGGEGGGDAAE